MIGFGGGGMVKYKWTGKNVDLAILFKEIESFFRRRNFSIRVGEPNKFELLALKRMDHTIRKIRVKVYGSPNEFAVEFVAGEQARVIQKLDVAWKFFGGGIFVLKAQEALEFYQKVEDEFWKYVQHLIAFLFNSAGSPSDS
jgi:hypothetical protein